MVKTQKVARVALLLVFLGASLVGCGSYVNSKVKRVDKETVKGWLDDPGVMIIDVRSESDWSSSDQKIKGAIRKDPGKAASWAQEISKDKKIVFYCA